MRFYLAGPMTGRPNFNFQMFEDSANHLRSVMNLDIASPHEINYGESDENRGSLPYEDYVRGGLKLLLECDAIIMQSGWETSKGCMTELYVAHAAGMRILFYDTDTGELTSNQMKHGRL